MMSLFEEMTQQSATERAWRAAERAETLAETGSDPVRWSQVARAWAAVAGQLPVTRQQIAQQQVPVPLPRPLRETETEQINTLRATGHLTDAELREQHAAVDVLRGVDPLDPRVPVDELDDEITRLIEVKAHEPLDYATQRAGAGTCRGCAQPVEWRGGVWIDVTGGALCRTPSR